MGLFRYRETQTQQKSFKKCHLLLENIPKFRKEKKNIHKKGVCILYICVKRVGHGKKKEDLEKMIDFSN